MTWRYQVSVRHEVRCSGDTRGQAQTSYSKIVNAVIPYLNRGLARSRWQLRRDAATEEENTVLPFARQE
jgi:hypothetical protein